MTILDEIFTYKREEVARRKALISLRSVRLEAERKPTPLDFVARISRPPNPALIAEIKRASPSRGILQWDIDPVDIANTVSTNGARAISILTDRHFFHGDLEDLKLVRQKFPLIPLLQKDFIQDIYQVYEARAAGADGVLLITAALELDHMADLVALSQSLGMAVLIEVHTLAELEKASKLQPGLVGINNRNLHTFEVRVENTLGILPYIPKGVTVVAESGIRSRKDVDALRQAGVHAILVGEAIMTAPDPGFKVGELAGMIPPVERLTAGDRRG